MISISNTFIGIYKCYLLCQMCWILTASRALFFIAYCMCMLTPSDCPSQLISRYSSVERCETDVLLNSSTHVYATPAADNLANTPLGILGHRATISLSIWRSTQNSFLPVVQNIISSPHPSKLISFYCLSSLTITCFTINSNACLDQLSCIEGDVNKSIKS